MRLFYVIVLNAFVVWHLSVADMAMESSANFHLDVNGIDLPIFFQDQSLGEEEKKMILHDYRQILTSLEPQNAYHSVIQACGQGDNIIRATKQLICSADYMKRPDAFHDQFGIVCTSKKGQEHILISKKLSDGYKVAFQLKRTYQDAYGSLSDFIQRKNHLKAEKLPPVQDIIYLYGEAQKFADEVANKSPYDFIDDYSRHRYASGSLLELNEKDGRLMSIMYVMDKNNGKRIGEMPIIYDAGRWKIYIALSGE